MHVPSGPAPIVAVPRAQKLLRPNRSYDSEFAYSKLSDLPEIVIMKPISLTDPTPISTIITFSKSVDVEVAGNICSRNRQNCVRHPDEHQLMRFVNRSNSMRCILFADCNVNVLVMSNNSAIPNRTEKCPEHDNRRHPVSMKNLKNSVKELNRLSCIKNHSILNEMLFNKYI